MEILRFIRWQWKRIHKETKQISLVIITTIMSIAYCWFAGVNFPLALLVVLGLGGLMVFLIFAYEQTNSAWNSYKVEKEEEAQRIVRKLSRGY